MQGIEIRITIDPTQGFAVHGPDLVEARSLYDYICSELQRLIARELEERRKNGGASPKIVRPDIRVMPG